MSKNRYYIGGRISEKAIEEIAEYFDQQISIKEFQQSIKSVKDKKTVYNILGKIRSNLVELNTQNISKLSSLDELIIELRNQGGKPSYPRNNKGKVIGYFIINDGNYYFSEKIARINRGIVKDMVKNSKKSELFNTFPYELIGIYNFTHKEFTPFDEKHSHSAFINELQTAVKNNYGVANETQASQILAEREFRCNFRGEKLSSVILMHLLTNPIRKGS